MPCLPIVQLGNTPITVESCVDGLLMIGLKRTRKVNTLTLLRRNVLRAPRIKIRPSEVMVIGGGEELAKYHYFPTPEDSPVNSSYRVGPATYAVLYHIVGPMTCEYPYHRGQAQEDLSDCLVPASLYGLKATRPGYCSADAKPATVAEAQAAFDSRKGFVNHVCDTDMNAYAVPVGRAGQGHQGAALFVCTQPESTVAWGHEPLFATLEQWAAH